MKKALIAILILLSALLIILLSISFYLITLDINDHKAFIEEKFEEVTGLNLEISGDLSLEIEKSIVIHSGKFELSDTNSLLATADSIVISIPLKIPKTSFLIEKVFVMNPEYHFSTAGIFPDRISGESSDSEPRQLDSLFIDSITVEGGSFFLKDEKGEIMLVAMGISASNANFNMFGFDDILNSFNTSARGKAEVISGFNFSEKNSSVDFNMQMGVLTFHSVLDSRPNEKFDVTIDLNPEEIVYRLQGNVIGQDVKEIAQNASQQGDYFRGTYNADFDISFEVPDSSVSLSSLTGNIEVRSDSLYIKGVNLDKMIKSFRRTQNFSLKDVGSVMLLGPWGLAVSKGSDYAELAFISEKDSSEIDEMYCQLKLEKGVIAFEDFAMRTRKNRVCLSGKVDLPEQTYQQFSYALLDKDGCSILREEYNGPFDQSRSGESINRFQLVLGPVTNLFVGTSQVITGKDCEYKYTGKVQLPEKKGLFGINLKKSKS